MGQGEIGGKGEGKCNGRVTQSIDTVNNVAVVLPLRAFGSFLLFVNLKIVSHRASGLQVASIFFVFFFRDSLSPL